MANVLFKRGTQADLNQLANWQDGTFYLTTDTHRLYTCINTELVDLTQNVLLYNNYDDFKKAENLVHGDFAYISNDNILAIYREDSTGTGSWTQINVNTDTDKYLESGVADVAADKDGITVNIILKQRTRNHNTGDDVMQNGEVLVEEIPIEFTIEADHFTTVSGETSVGLELDNLTIKAEGAGADSNDLGVTFVAGDNITLTPAGDSLTIAAKDDDTTYELKTVMNTPEDGSSPIYALELHASNTDIDTIILEDDDVVLLTADNNNKIKAAHKSYGLITPTSSDGNSLEFGETFTAVTGVTVDAYGHTTGYITEQFTLPTESDDIHLQSVTLNGNAEGQITGSLILNNTDEIKVTSDKTLFYQFGDEICYNQAKLPAYYSKAEMDSKLRTLDAMVYKGTVGYQEANPGSGILEIEGTVRVLPNTDVQHGDTYKVIVNGTYANFNCTIGDLLIATGDENTDGVIDTGNLTWTWIPSGDDTDSQYDLQIKNDQIILLNTSIPGGEEFSAIKPLAGDVLDITCDAANNSFTYKHKNIEQKVNPAVGSTSLSFGGTVDILTNPGFDGHGHIESFDTVTYQLPALPNAITYDLTVVEKDDNGNPQGLLFSNSATDETYIEFDKENDYIEVKVDANNKKITPVHKTYTTENYSSQAGETVSLSHEGTFTVVANVVRDSGGHLASYQTQTYKLPTVIDYGLNGEQSVTENVATFTTTLTGAADSVHHTLTSDTFVVSEKDNNVVMNLEWGSFK